MWGCGLLVGLGVREGAGVWAVFVCNFLCVCERLVRFVKEYRLQVVLPCVIGVCETGRFLDRSCARARSLPVPPSLSVSLCLFDV